MIPFLVAAAVIILDQISKYIISTNMDINASFNLVPHIINITYIENAGAGWGILEGHRWVFMILSSVALVLMAAVIIYLVKKKSHMFLQVSLAMMFGGGVGNMIDRFSNVTVQPGRFGEGAKVVVDFIEFAFFKFPVFNLADTFICIGSALFCICIFTNRMSLFRDIKNKEKNEGNNEENIDEIKAESEESEETEIL